MLRRLVRVHVNLQHVGGHHPHEEEVEGEVEEEESTDLAPLHPQEGGDRGMRHEVSVFWNLGHVPQRLCLWQLLSYFGNSNLEKNDFYRDFQKLSPGFSAEAHFHRISFLVVRENDI